MNTLDYENTLDKAVSDGIVVHEKYNMSGTRFKGLYCDGCVALSDELETSTQRKCVLLEEIGHHKTSYGNIMDLHDEISIKQERKARIWAYKNAIALSGIIQAYKYGCRNRFETAEYLDVTEQFLDHALSFFKEFYGIYTKYGDYIIYFEPLGVLKLYQNDGE